MKRSSEGLFEKLLETQQIFKDREYLRPTYTPHDLPHREKQVDHLARIWVAPLRGETPSNVFIYGKPGTGKTAAVKYLMDELERTSEDVSSNIEAVYLNCELVNTKYRILASITNRLQKSMRSRGIDFLGPSKRVPKTGWPTDSVYKAFLDTIDSLEQTVIVILDEVDKLAEGGVDDVLYVLTRVGSDLKKAKTGIVGISNDLNFVSHLDPRVVSSLGEEEIVFPPYDALQLEDILRGRAEISFFDGVVSDAVIRLCAAHAAAKHGDARRALDMLRIAGELAEKDEVSRVTVDHVKRASDKIERDMIEGSIRTLPKQSKYVLWSVLLLQERGLRRIKTGDIYDTYRSLCVQSGLSVLTERRVSELISDLALMGILNMRVVSRGRYGRTKEVELNVDPNMTRAAMQDEICVKDLDSFLKTDQSKLW